MDDVTVGDQQPTIGGEEDESSTVAFESAPSTTTASSLLSDWSNSSRTTFVSCSKSLAGHRSKNLQQQQQQRGRRPSSRKSLPPFLAVRANGRQLLATQRGGNSKKALQMFSNLVGFVRGRLRSRRSVREYKLSWAEPQAANRRSGSNSGPDGQQQNMHRTRSSLRRPQLLSVRPRESVCVPSAASCPAQAFELLLNLCHGPEDVAHLRAHPEQLAQLGILDGDKQSLATLFEELYFFLSKCEQLKEAEQRVEEKKQRKKENVTISRNGKKRGKK